MNLQHNAIVVKGRTCPALRIPASSQTNSMTLKLLCACTSLLFIFSSAAYSLQYGSTEHAQVQSVIISAVSDGAGWFKFVKGVPRGAVLKASFTDRINTTG